MGSEEENTGENRVLTGEVLSPEPSALQRQELALHRLETTLEGIHADLGHIAISIEGLPISIRGLSKSIDGISRNVTKMNYMLVVYSIATVGILGYATYAVRSRDSTFRDFNRETIETNRTIDNRLNIVESGLDRLVESVYESHPITIPMSIAEARRDIENISDGYHPKYDLLVIRDMLNGGYNLSPNLIRDAKGLYAKFAEHERKVALAENPNQYRNELLELLTQKVNLEQRLLTAMPADYAVMPRF